MTRVSLVCVVMALTAAAAGAHTPSPAGDQAALAAWMPGVFDNFQQVFEERDAKSPRPHDRIHAVVSPVIVPALGDRVFLVQYSRPDVPSSAPVFRFHSLAGPAPGGGVLQRVYELAGDRRTVDPAVDAAWLAALSVEQFRPLTGCDVTWRRTADGFVGTTRPGACRVPAAAGRDDRAIDSAYTLTATSYSIDERPEGERLTAGPAVLLRGRLFTCFAVLRKDGTTDQYDTALGLTVHDQGQMVPIALPPGAPGKYAFELSQLRYGNKTPIMKLALYETGKEAAFTYAWADPPSMRIGINLRWLQVGCSPKTP